MFGCNYQSRSGTLYNVEDGASTSIPAGTYDIYIKGGCLSGSGQATLKAGTTVLGTFTYTQSVVTGYAKLTNITVPNSALTVSISATNNIMVCAEFVKK